MHTYTKSLILQLLNTVSVPTLYHEIHLFVFTIIQGPLPGLALSNSVKSE